MNIFTLPVLQLCLIHTGLLAKVGLLCIMIVHCYNCWVRKFHPEFVVYLVYYYSLEGCVGIGVFTTSKLKIVSLSVGHLCRESSVCQNHSCEGW